MPNIQFGKARMRDIQMLVSPMKTILLIGMILLSEHMFANEAYVLVDAVVVPRKANQPTWLAIKGTGKFTHVPVGQSVVAVAPGKYRLAHVDFQKSKHLGIGSLLAPSGRKSIRFEAIPNTITYVGLIELKRAGWKGNVKQYKLSLSSTGKILEWACHTKPELFVRFPVRITDKDGSTKEIRIRCET